MALKVFMDTEFTDFMDSRLISIGMASESGEEFYAEVPYTYSACSDFVRETVVPELGKIPGAGCTLQELSTRMLVWLERLKCHDHEVEICFDYQRDWDLFISSLDYQVPPWCRQRLVADKIDERLCHEFHQKHKLPMHHALYDALANRYAFCEGERAFNDGIATDRSAAK